ncbi:MAG: heparinase II/III family protein [Parvularculaceae bacterium]
MAASRRANGALSVAQDVVSRVQRAWGESPFYQAQLKGPAPDRLHFQPIDPRTPDRALGAAMIKGRVTIGAEEADCEGDVERIWDIAVAPCQLHSFLHDFSWLRHCGALGEAAIEPTRALTRAWLDRFGKWSPEAWEPFLTAERLTQLCCHSALLMRGADALWKSRLLTSMARQTRHLARAGHRANTGYERLMTALGLSIAALCLPGCDEEAERGLELLRRELRLQIRPDGGHVSRSPSQQLSIVLRLQIVLKALEARRLATPGFLKHIVGRATANVQFFRAGDGHLAVFNGGYEDDARAVVAALQSLDPDAVPTGFARHTGFQRLEAARALIIADVSAATSPRRFDSASSFHFSSGRSRIVVNCGNGAHLPGEWVRALCFAAAHSTLSAETAAASAMLAASGTVLHRRAEDGRGQLLEIDRTFDERDAEKSRYVRRIFVSPGGDDVRGEDQLVGAPEVLMQNWRLRFHLHPTVRASLARDGRSVILALPNREGWRFRTNCHVLRLEKSVYCGSGGLPAATEQIVLAPSDFERREGSDMLVKWAFRRLEGASAAESQGGR